MTPTTVRFVLVEGQDADGATMERDAFAVHNDGPADALHTSKQTAAAVRRTKALAAARGHRLHSIGVTWSDDADTEASLLLESLSDSGFDNVVAVRLPEATDALARGIAEVTGYEFTAVCVIEPETVMVLVVNDRDGAVQTAVNQAIADNEDLIGWLSAVFARVEWAPEALVVVGSAGGLDDTMPELEEAVHSRRETCRARPRVGLHAPQLRGGTPCLPRGRSARVIAIIFAGPTISAERAPAIAGVEWRPPARQGDIYKATLSRPAAIGLVDGYFEVIPTVWHKEILWAMTLGIHVYGAAEHRRVASCRARSFWHEGSWHNL